MGNDFFWIGAHVLGERRIFFLGERAKRVKKKWKLRKRRQTRGKGGKEEENVENGGMILEREGEE